MSKTVTLISAVDSQKVTFVLNKYNEWERSDTRPIEPADLQDALDRICELESLTN